MTDRNKAIIQMYKDGNSSHEIHDKFPEITVRQIQRIIKGAGVTRSVRDSWNLSVSKGRRNFDSFNKITYGYVYLIESEYGRHKIGYSMSPTKNRIPIMESSGGVRLKLLASKYSDNAKGIESDLIRKCWSSHLFREWFQLTNDQVEEIKKELT